jgi:hypothetical protein
MEIKNKFKKLEILEDLFSIRKHISEHRLMKHLRALYNAGETSVDYNKRGNSYLALRLRKFMMQRALDRRLKIENMELTEFTSCFLSDQFLSDFQEAERDRINEQTIARAKRLTS